jgi:hypothetical protein
MKSFLALLTAVALFGANSNVAPLGKYTAAERRHWSFQPRSTPAVPAFTAAADQAWAKQPIDAFVLARLQKAGLSHSTPASKQVLVRRLYFDLTGLPPTPQQVSSFVNDKRPDATERLVNTLLDSPHYGERWGQHWLDVVRFAETDGFEYDTHRSEAYRFRDYVIRAFQNDKPYNRFLEEQLAGDEIGGKEQETLIAAGFNRLGPLRKNAGNQEVASSRNEVLTEMTNATGAAFLGVTLGCARCHDHKFDPIRQSDYYRIQAYFASTVDNDFLLGASSEKTAWEEQIKPIDAEVKKLQGEMAKAEGLAKEALARKIIDLEDSKPAPPPTLYSVQNNPAKASPINLLARGEYTAKGDSVGMRPLGVLLPEASPELPPIDKPRTELAKWITAPDNPLTARVMVNRIWHYHFGRGIVATPNDFGRMGAAPTHKELLDYLANEFIASGYSIKHMHRLILLTNTWQQASNTVDAKAAESDPENKLLWKYSRRRLEAEELRDAMLRVSGQLNPKQFGPSIMIPIEKELTEALYKPTQWRPDKDPSQYQRRSIYLIAKRNLHLPMMEVFDAPDALVSCSRRETSTHAPQALELLNGTFANEQAEAFSKRLSQAKGNVVDEAFLIAAGRPPNEKERALSAAFLKQRSLKEFALAMFNLNAFLYVN